MIRVVIVDDEMLIRVGIKSSIDWEENGFEIAGQAENGIKALEVIEETRPDIVLTDIKMPKMDGLELISEIRKRYPHIRTIVLSCYNEIEYVKSAMKLGAEDYLLKLSIEPETLLQVLNKVKASIDVAPAGNSPAASENERKIDQSVLKENIYRKMIAGSISANVFVSEMSFLGVHFNSDTYIVMCCCIDDFPIAAARSKMGDRYLFKYSFINILEESLSAYSSCDIAEVGDGEYIILLRYTDSSELFCSKENLVSCLIKMNNSIKKYLNVSITFGVSTLHVPYGDVRSAYLLAKMAMQFKFYLGRESIVFTDETKNFSAKDIILNYECEQKLQKKLDDFDGAGVKTVLHSILDDIAAVRETEPEKVRKLSVEIFHNMMKFIKRFDTHGDFIASSFSTHPLDFLMNAETLSDIMLWFEGSVDRLYEYIYNHQLEAKRPEIIKLQKYIAENISENITLDKAVKISNVSKCYLSSIFKKETGEAFVDYVNRKKMERAKALIQDQHLKIYEAAEKVGFADESYFSKLFKKYIGVSPSKLVRS